MNLRILPRAAFTLTEIVLTLGIITFALVAIIGMIPVALDADRAAGEDTALAAMANRVSSDLHSRGFAELTVAGSANPKPWPYYFDVDGIPQPGSAGAIYECFVIQSGAPVPKTGALSPGAPPASPNLLEFEIQFEWPLAAAAANRKTRAIPMTIANYE